MSDQRTTNSFVDAFTRDIPRGVTSRSIREQSLPQARWADFDVVYNSEALAYDPCDPGGKVLLGALGDKLIGIEDNRHILTVAGSRAGKSLTVTANALFYPGSMIATDPKGELANITARRREELGQRVLILDPVNKAADRLSHLRASYNFMAILRPDSPTVIEDADLIADAIVVVSDRDPHWDESAKNFITGVILDTACNPMFDGRSNLVTVRERINMALRPSPPPEDEEEAEGITFVLEEEMMENAWRLKQVPETYDRGAAIEAATRDFYEKSYKERDSVLSTARRHTRFLDYTGVRAVSQRHDFDLADLKREKLSVYLCVPASLMSIYQRWLRLFVNQLLTAMEGERSVPDVPVLVCLDEFPVLGYSRPLESAIGQIASFGVRLWVICQDWGQGKALYKDRWPSFAANAGVMQWFGNVDSETLNVIREMLGKTTVQVTREGEASAEQRYTGVTGRSTDIQLHDLLAPDEIARVCARDHKDKKQIVMVAGRLPMMIQRVEHYDETGPFRHIFKGKCDEAL